MLQQLTDWEILLTPPEIEGEKPVSDAVSPQVTNNGIQLKSSLEWIYHPEDYWILRNPENLTNLQIDNFDKEIISQLQLISIPAIANQYDITLEELQYLLQMLAASGMLEGINPQKPPKKFNLMQLFYYQIPVFNPDVWLTKHIDKLRWIWTWPIGFILCAFITSSIAVWLDSAEEAIASNQTVWAIGGSTTVLTLAVLIMLVTFLHELGHAC